VGLGRRGERERRQGEGERGVRTNGAVVHHANGGCEQRAGPAPPGSDPRRARPGRASRGRGPVERTFLRRMTGDLGLHPQIAQAITAARTR
jgi:hypothetical protein